MRAVALKVMSGAAGGRILTLVATLVAAAILGPTGFGIFALAMASAQMLGLVATLGLARAAIRLLPRYEVDPARQRMILTASLRASVLVILLVWVTLMLLPSTATEAWLPGGNSIMVLGVALWMVGFTCSNYVSSILTGLHRQGQAALWVLTRAVLFSAVLLVSSLVVPVHWAVCLCGAVELFAAATALVLVLLRQRKVRDAQAPRTTARIGRELVTNGLPGWLTDVSVQAALWFLILGLTHSAAGAAAAGAFAVGQRAFVMVSMLPRQAAISFVPFLVRARSEPTAWRSTVIRTLRWVTMLAVVIALVGSLALILFSGLIGAYADSRWALLAMCIIGVLGAANSALGVVAQAGGSLASWGASEVLASVVTVTLALLTLDSWGLSGAIIAFAAGHVTRSVMLATGRGWRVALPAKT